MALLKRTPSTWDSATGHLGWGLWNPDPTNKRVPLIQLAEIRGDSHRKRMHIRPVGPNEWDPNRPLTTTDFKNLVSEGRLDFGVGLVDRLGSGCLIAADSFLGAFGPLGSHGEVVRERLIRGLIPLEPSTEATLSSVRDPELREEFARFMANRPVVVGRLDEWARISGIAYIILGEERTAALQRGDRELSETLIAAQIRALLSAPPDSEYRSMGEMFAESIEIGIPLKGQIELLKAEYDEVASRLMIDEAIVLVQAMLRAQAENGEPLALGLLDDPAPAVDLADKALDNPEIALNGFVSLVA